MGAKIHPQNRARSSMMAMIEARQPDLAQADDWIARGWNPFKPQADSHWRAKAGFEEMAELGGRWTQWLLDREALWGPLARAALPPGSPPGSFAAGEILCDAASHCWGPERGMLSMLLAIGADPDARGRASAPPLHQASRHGAEALLAAGADPLARDITGRQAWICWAGRCHDRGSFGIVPDDLDWLAQRCPPSPSGGAPVDCLHLQKPQVLRRMSAAGYSPEALGFGDRASLARALLSLMRDADSRERLEAIGDAAGWPETIAASLELPERERLCALDAAAYMGRPRCLGLLEERGLFSSGAISPEEAALSFSAAWASMSAPPRDWRYGLPKAAGMVWIAGRLPKGAADAAQRALLACAAASPIESARFALACASKGLLPASGPASAMELYKGGEDWDEDLFGQSFAQFCSLVESKAMKQAFKKPSKAPPARRRL